MPYSIIHGYTYSEQIITGVFFTERWYTLIMLRTIHAGYISEHPSDFICHMDDSYEYWTIINTISDAEILIDNIWTHIPPNQVIIFPPHTAGDYRAYNNTPYVNHWVSFVTDEKFIINTTLPSATPIPIHCQDLITYIFHMIATENCFDNEYKSQSLDHLFHLLFYKLNESMSYAGSSVGNSLRGELNRIRFEMLSNPSFDWSVPYIANQLNLSVGYTQNIYKKTFGISCMEDVFEQRVNLAKNYLTQTNYSTSEIAEICGYKCTEHFCRQFRRITGMTATDYRKSQSFSPIPSMNHTK